MKRIPWVRSGSEGQMTVELAVLIPPAIVLAIVLYNLMGFIDSCAAFDRLSLDAVVAHGVAPGGTQTSEVATGEVEQAIRLALGREGSCEVQVEAAPLSDTGQAGEMLISPLLTRYTCTLLYKPWPRSIRMPGITVEVPLALKHERTLVVDKFRPGVVM